MFRLQGSKVLAVDMTGDAVKAKNGSMVAYDGQMAFKKLSGGGEGIRGMVTRRLTGEQMTVMEVRGQGTCWFADRASEINLVQLRGDKLFVESSNLLATDAGLRTGTSFTGVRGATQGNGLFTTTVEGTGQAAITSDGPAVVLRVSPQYAQAYVDCGKPLTTAQATNAAGGQFLASVPCDANGNPLPVAR